MTKSSLILLLFCLAPAAHAAGVRSYVPNKNPHKVVRPTEPAVPAEHAPEETLDAASAEELKEVLDQFNNRVGSTGEIPRERDVFDSMPSR